ncbi:glycosyl hydrolases family 31-domain-containing protein [Absidia repens]|uniref:Glycosyl hydrolases family 31-domain-containing protein n=1 Tax=Absidia repens TaxID=90262 RepID=A0A1X2IZL5_9FUNG|nr:glycosyl hydrolases family 31-domain-containing protein [Absidia repens]
MGTGAALCAVPGGYGHDNGGFAGPAPTPEQLVRWVQQGIFWTRFCIHSFNSDKSITEPWMYPEVLPTIKSAIQWRYKWIPHLYSLYVNLTYRNNEPVVRPTFYDHLHDKRTLQQDFDFMVGPQLLVAPVYKQGATDRQVYLPSFQHQLDVDGGWYHYQTGQHYRGGQDVSVPTFLDDSLAPLFIKEGTFMCYGKCMPHFSALPDDERRIQIYPPPMEAATVSYLNREFQEEKPYRWKFMLTEDDGHTTGHQQNNSYTDVELWMECYTNRILVGIDILYDGYFPEYDTLWVTCPLDSEKRPLVFDGQDEDDTQVTNLLDAPDEYYDENYVYRALKINWKKSNKA